MEIVFKFDDASIEFMYGMGQPSIVNISWIFSGTDGMHTISINGTTEVPGFDTLAMLNLSEISKEMLLSWLNNNIDQNAMTAMKNTITNELAKLSNQPSIPT